MSETRRIEFFIAGPKGGGEGVYMLVHRDTNEWWYSHFCSNASYAPGDLILGRPERILQIRQELNAPDAEIEVTLHQSLPRVPGMSDRWVLHPDEKGATS